MGALVADPQDNMFSKKIFWLAYALLLIGVQAEFHQMDVHAQAAECCQEKMVGGVSYSLLPEAFDGSLPHQCLTSCVYTKTGMSSPKFCFARGELATECRDPPHHTEALGSSYTNGCGSLFVTCDDEVKVYFDGIQQEQTSGMRVWQTVSQVTIPAGTKVVALECRNLETSFGILASAPTAKLGGLVTDSNWKCAD